MTPRSSTLLLGVILTFSPCQPTQNLTGSINAQHIARCLVADALAKIVATVLIIMAEPNCIFNDLSKEITGKELPSILQSTLYLATVIAAPIMYQKMYDFFAIPHDDNKEHLFIERASSLTLRLLLPYPLAHILIHT